MGGWWCVEWHHTDEVMWGQIAWSLSPGELEHIIYIVVKALDVALQALREAAALLVDAAH